MTLSARWSTCALCPRLCRTACPVATGAAREAAVPSFLAIVLGEWERDRVDDATALEAATLCTDCGACQDRCHIDRPLPDLLREVRSSLVPTPRLDPLSEIEGDADWIAIEADDRPLATALEHHLGRPVARWTTTDRLGVAAIEHPIWKRRVERLRAVVGTRHIVVADGGVAQALSSAGIGFQWLHEVDRTLTRGTGSCSAGGDRPLACCGGAGPLPVHHPEDAVRVGQLWLERSDEWKVVDARCRDHLRGCGGEATDPLDQLLVRTGLAEGGGRDGAAR